VTDSGIALLGRLGIDLDDVQARAGKPTRRLLCRPCLDWSERRPHLAGTVGAALLAHYLAHGWLRRIDATRAVALTPKGQRGFHDAFGVRLT
jgi:hypothetical protein